MPGLKTDRFRHYRFTRAEYVITVTFTIVFEFKIPEFIYFQRSNKSCRHETRRDFVPIIVRVEA